MWKLLTLGLAVVLAAACEGRSREETLRAQASKSAPQPVSKKPAASVDSRPAGSGRAKTEVSMAVDSEKSRPAGDLQLSKSSSEQAKPETTSRRGTRAPKPVATSRLPERSPAESRRCPRFSAHEALAKCSGKWTWLHDMRVKPGAPFDCSDVWLLDGTYYETMEAAIEAEGCYRKCVYERGSMTDGTRCGKAFWVMTLRAKNHAGCPPLYQVYDGFHESLEDWSAAHPCPEGTDETTPRQRVR